MFIAFVATATAAVPPKPIGDPAFWFGPSNYPAEAKKRGFEGTVGFEVDVDARGRPTACQIRASSGQPSLDQATCDAVRSNAHFEPAKSVDGKAVPGRYNNSAVWQIIGPPSPGYSAVILDFSSDPAHPTCTTQSEGPSMRGQTCAQLLDGLRPTLFVLGTKWTKMVALMSIATGDQEPYRGEADWGPRLSYSASDQYYLDGPVPVACVSVAAEGMETGQDACRQFGGAHRLDEKVSKDARKMRVEVSIFATARN